MRILNLQAENIKRLTAVEITPDGSLVEITGKNGNGKTSVLDAIWWALEGASHIQDEPIRAGAKKAVIRLHIGDRETKFIVTRAFSRPKDGTKAAAKAYTTTLTVEAPDGEVMGQPQKVLDALIGQLSFDPLAFMRMGPQDQAESLRRLVQGIDFDELARQDEIDSRKRADFNREAKSARVEADALSYPAGTTDEPVSVAELSKELAAANEQNRKAADFDREIAEMQARAKRMFEDAAAKRQTAANMRKEADNLDAAAEAIETEAYSLDEQGEIRERLETVDISGIAAKMDSASETNRAVDAKRRKAELTRKAIAAEDEAGKLTDRMAARARQRIEAFEKARLPVDGLTLGADGVRLNDLPLAQASDAMQRRVSIGIAMALNPELRVARIRDGALLDSDAMADLAALAAEQDFQIWVETVDSNRPGAIVIQDGTVAGRVQQAAE